MRHKRVFAVASAAIAAAAVLFATPAGAQELLPITVDPTSGPAGTAVAVSGADCLTEDPGLAPEVEIFFGDDSGGELAASIIVVPETDGTWSGEITVPDVDPDVMWVVTATCFDGPGQDAGILADYQFVDFDVTGPPTTPTTTPPPTTPTTPPAPPATAVPGEPTFTG